MQTFKNENQKHREEDQKALSRMKYYVKMTERAINRKMVNRHMIRRG